MKWVDKGQDPRCKVDRGPETGDGDGDGDGIMNNEYRMSILWSSYARDRHLLKTQEGQYHQLRSKKRFEHSNEIRIRSLPPQHLQQLLSNHFSKFLIVDMILQFNNFNR